MYAVIETGGKQYRVELGTELAVERLDGTPGDSISFERVLLVADGDQAQVGTPVVADALVTADVLRQDRGEKVIVFKYRPKARHRSKKGHRQEQTVIRVADIRFNGRSAADESSAQQKEESKARKAAAAEAERKAAADKALAAKLERQAAEQQAEAKADEKPAKPRSKRAASAKVDAKPAKADAKPAKPRSRAKATEPKADQAAGEDQAKPAKTTRTKATRKSTKKDE